MVQFVKWFLTIIPFVVKFCAFTKIFPVIKFESIFVIFNVKFLNKLVLQIIKKSVNLINIPLIVLIAV